MDTKEEARRISLITLKELRRLYDHLNRNYDALRVKTLAFIAGETAIVSFIFSSAGNNDSVPLMPIQDYGKIFFWVGAALISIAFLMFISVILPAEWQIPLDLKEVEHLHKRHKTMESFLDYILDDYVGCIKHCLSVHKKRSARFNWAIYALIVGVIILMVLKFRGV